MLIHLKGRGKFKYTESVRVCLDKINYCTQKKNASVTQRKSLDSFCKIYKLKDK